MMDHFLSFILYIGTWVKFYRHIQIYIYEDVYVHIHTDVCVYSHILKVDPLLDFITN